MDRYQLYTGRGALTNPAGRFERLHAAQEHDGWSLEEEPLPTPATTLRPERARSIISRHDSPDIPFSQSINPYRGCEHGCIYCYARPSHSYVNLSPGLDFETQIFFKDGAAERLEAAFRKPGYRCETITIGANTDPYQPAEKRLEVTRSLLQVMRDYQHPVALISKGSLILRDLDLLKQLAANDLVSVAITLTTLKPELKRILEPRAASPKARLGVIEQLSQAGIPVTVMAAPMIPAINDAELEHILAAAARAGARHAGYVMVRLPYEVKDLFRDWLAEHFPDRAAHVMSLIRQSRGGKDYDASFGTRMRGSGVFAELLATRFHKACQRYGLNTAHRGRQALATHHFFVPPQSGDQLRLLN